MLDISTSADTVLRSNAKSIKWLFEIDTYYWSTQATTYDGNTYDFKVLPSTFTGIKLARNKSEFGLHSPNTTQFSVSNPSNTLNAEDFVGQTLYLRLIISGYVDGTLKTLEDSDTGVAFVDTDDVDWLNTFVDWEQEYGRIDWKFKVDRCESHDNQLDFYCEDFLQYYLNGDYPNTKLISSIFPSDEDEADQSSNLCEPVPFGLVYIPLKHVVYDSNDRYFLGSSDYTYTYNKVRTPIAWGGDPKTYVHGEYTINQDTATVDGESYQLLNPVLFDTDENGTPDSIGLWKSGNKYLEVLAEFSRSDTVSTINPADHIQYVLEDFGVASGELNIGSGSKFAASSTRYDDWGLTFVGAYLTKSPRKKVTSNLLNMCHSVLRVSDTIDLDILKKESQGTLGVADITRQKNDASTFKFTYLQKNSRDSGHIKHQISGETQANLIKTVVAISGETTDIASEILDCTFINDSENAQRAGTLYYQRKFAYSKQVKFTGKSYTLVYQPDDVITISGERYGGEYDVVVDNVWIKPELAVDITAVKYDVLDDWLDNSPSARTSSSSTGGGAWSPTVTGGYNAGTPSTVDGLDSEAWMRGAKFFWEPSKESENVKYYQTRFKIIADGGTPESSWSSWEKVDGTNAFKFLTDAEQVTYGKDATIHIEVKATNINSTDSSTDTTSVECLSLNADATDIDDFAIIASKLFTNIPVVESDSWTDNSPSAGYVAWNEHYLYYGGVQYTISAASTSTKYIYWVNGASEYSGSDQHPTLADGDFIIATNVDGEHDLAWNAIANQVIGSAYIQDASIESAKIVSLNADKVNAVELSAISADLGTINAGDITGVTIVGSTIKTASSGKRVQLDSNGITLVTTDSVGKYGTFQYGDGTKYGSGALAYIQHNTQQVPFYISAEQAVGDFHYYNRTSNPSGSGEIGDTCVVGGLLKICTSAGVPGTWTVVGDQTAP